MNELDTTAIAQWVGYHDAKFQPYTTRGLQMLAARMRKLGSPRVQAAAVAQSIANGWQGLFAPRGRFAVQEIDDMECPT